MRQYNKGEWGELYTAVKILNDKKIAVADNNLESRNECVNVLRLFLKSTYSDNSIYDITTPKILLLVDGILKKTLTLDEDDVSELLQSIQNGAGRSFSVPIAEKIIQDLKLDAVKANSTVKADIVMEADIPYINEKSEIYRVGAKKEGFTIKSMIGAKPTLLNTSQSTNFIFNVSGFTGNLNHINSMTGAAKIMKRVDSIKKHGGTITFLDTASEIFKKNLRLIDYNLPEILSCLLIVYFTTSGKSNLPSLVKQIIPLLSFSTSIEEVEHKIKAFIYAIALGMHPAKLWDGRSINGGCIIAKNSGDLVCFTLFDQDAFKEYLYNNIKFDSPSSTRHHYGMLYMKNNRLFINLNIQLRFL